MYFPLESIFPIDTSIDMTYLDDEDVVCLTDDLSWDEDSVGWHNNILYDRIVQGLDYAFQKKHIKRNEDITPSVRIIFKQEPVAETYEILNRAKYHFDYAKCILEWKYCPSENDEQETDDSTNIPDDQ